MGFSDKNITRIGKKDSDSIISSNSHDLESGIGPLLDRIGNARIVLLGEASHGTHEYYLWRARITRKLITENKFNIIGVEGDWPDCYRINRYIRNYENNVNNAIEVLENFHRWPAWMWANWEIAELMEWLREHNKGKGYNQQAGFYGLDIYSLWESLEAIREYLRENDPDALATAEKAMQCFQPYDKEGADYGSSTFFTSDTCENEVVELLTKIRARVPLYNSDPEAPFNAEQNAITAVEAERYYREMIKGGPASWNIRDVHMTNTLERLLNFHGKESKAIVWKHNTHVGDARATNMHRKGMVNVGQLARERWGESLVILTGFGSYRGKVVAGRTWGGRMQEMNVPEARKDSWEAVLHNILPTDKLIITEDIKESPLMSGSINHRAIGVVYEPEMEHFGNYVPSQISRRYDAFVYVDESSALHPLDTKSETQITPDTYPWGL